MDDFDYDSEVENVGVVKRKVRGSLMHVVFLNYILLRILYGRYLWCILALVASFRGYCLSIFYYEV